MSTWRRDVCPSKICACSHSYEAHNTDRKALPCQAGGCDCTAWSLKKHRWRETRWVEEDVA